MGGELLLMSLSAFLIQVITGYSKQQSYPHIYFIPIPNAYSV